jgi:serine/threonine protein kinase
LDLFGRYFSFSFPEILFSQQCLQILLLESCHKSGELVRITPSLHSACIPEVLSAIQKADTASAVDKPTVNASLEMDVWSYGCILYQVFTGRKLFSGPSSAMIELIQNSETFRVPPEELGDVIAKYYFFVAFHIASSQNSRYIVENSVCISPRDRILMRDILL